MARINIKTGDVFVVKLDSFSKKYLQYIANDLTQLNSDVIRVFAKTYAIDESPDLVKVVNEEVDFYAHCVLKWGIKLGFWEKVTNVKNNGDINIIFRDSEDYGNPHIKISNNWWVWKINQRQEQVGKLEGIYKKAEIGSVIPPDSIVHRMRTGKYDFQYPDFE